MKVIETGFEGLILIEPQQFEDHRSSLRKKILSDKDQNFSCIEDW